MPIRGGQAEHEMIDGGSQLVKVLAHPNCPLHSLGGERRLSVEPEPELVHQLQFDLGDVVRTHLAGRG
jgi:hypothetical protein